MFHHLISVELHLSTNCFLQLLLTFDPILVEKVSILALHVMEDNPVLSRAYLSGKNFKIFCRLCP